MDNLANIDWMSLVTAILASSVVTGSLTGFLYKLLKKIKISDTSAKIASAKIVTTATELATKQKTENEAITELKDTMTEMVKNTKELEAIYTDSLTIVNTSIKLLTETKQIINDFQKED